MFSLILCFLLLVYRNTIDICLLILNIIASLIWFISTNIFVADSMGHIYIHKTISSENRDSLCLFCLIFLARTSRTKLNRIDQRLDTLVLFFVCLIYCYLTMFYFIFMWVQEYSSKKMQLFSTTMCNLIHYMFSVNLFLYFNNYNFFPEFIIMY